MTAPNTDILTLLDFGQRFKHQLDAEVARRDLKVSQWRVLQAIEAVVGKANEKGIPNCRTIDAAAKAWCDRFEQEQKESEDQL
jgi:hypothetical protein